MPIKLHKCVFFVKFDNSYASDLKKSAEYTEKDALIALIISPFVSQFHGHTM